MIPKVLHFCWLSNDPYPAKIQKCIDSWRRVLPDYEIRLWNFERLGDAANQWVREAFDKKKYAFAADFVRAYALYHEGGIYLDSDVEILKTFDSLLELPYFLGYESGANSIEAACMGAEKGHPLFGHLLEYYRDRRFIQPDGSCDMTPMPIIMQQIVKVNFSLQPIDSIRSFDQDHKKICVLPDDYFSPVNLDTSELRLTSRTMAIHHFAASWCSPYTRFKQRMQKLLGGRITRIIISAKRKILKSRISR